jgi:hypothetical protein
MTNQSESYLGKLFGCGGKVPWRVIWSAMALALALVADSYLGLRFGRETARWALLLPVAAGAWFAWEQVLNLRRMDELQIRLFFESVSVAALAVMLMAILWPSLERAGFGGTFKPLHVLVAFPLAFLCSYLAAVKRYL